MDIYEAYEAFEMPDGYPFSRMTTRIQYTAPAFPGSDAGCFPAAHVRETLDSEYSDWLDVLAYCDEYRAYSRRMAALYDCSEPEFEDDSEATLRVDAGEDDWKLGI